VTDFSARLCGPARDIAPEVWDGLANPEGAALPHPFTRHDFFTALEESGSATTDTGWTPLHLMLSRGATPVALLPLYLKSHSYGEYVFDHGWADAFARVGGDYYPKLQASVPFTPVPGRRFLIGAGEDRKVVAPLLLNAAMSAVRETDASSLHITFLSEEEWSMAGEHGFLRRMDQQFHWDNKGYTSFDHFLEDLSSAKRKTLRKERAAVAASGVSFEWRTGSDLTEKVWDAFFNLYTLTGSRKWNDPYLTRDFFSRIGATMGNQILLVMAKHQGAYVAGALNLFDGEALYGRNWGAAGFIPFLHFETCYYQAIDFAIARGLNRVEAGAQGGHKFLRGYMPKPTWSAHYIRHQGLRAAVEDYLERERAAVLHQIDELSAHAPYRKA
jgi:predicted N-acyltransferase